MPMASVMWLSMLGFGAVSGFEFRDFLFPLLDGGGSVFRQFGRLLRGGGGEAEEGEE